MNNTQEKPCKGKKWSLRLFHNIKGTDKVWNSCFYNLFGSTTEAEDAGWQLVADPSNTIVSFEAF